MGRLVNPPRDLKRSIYQLSLRPTLDPLEAAPWPGEEDAAAAVAPLASLPRPDSMPELFHAGAAIANASAGPPVSAVAAGSSGGAAGHVAGPGGGPWVLRGDVRGHSGAVYAVRFAPGGRLLASAGFSGVVRVWDLARQAEALALAAHSLPVSDVAWSADSSLLVSASHDAKYAPHLLPLFALPSDWPSE